MRKYLNIFVFLCSFLFGQQNAVMAAKIPSKKPSCQRAEKEYLLYGLKADEVSDANTNDFYCWEIRYLRDYQHVLSMGLESYKALFSKTLSHEEFAYLRKKGITPEKYDYLYRYFIPHKSKKSFESRVNSAISKASKEVGTKAQYKYGRPILFVPPITWDPIYAATQTIQSVVSTVKVPTFYYPLLRILGIECVNGILSGFDVYPEALRPSGIMGQYIINPFAEIVGYIETNTKWGLGHIQSQPIYLLNGKALYSFWNPENCNITNLADQVKGSFSCISCTIFEISFNTVSRIGFILFDKLARYAIDFMIALFALWSLLMFYNSVIKKQDGWDYIKTFFTKSIWLVIIGAFLTVSITDENNIINYTVTPLTEFMAAYNQKVTEMVDKEKVPFQCKYATKDIANNKVIFSREVKQNIVCTIERISMFNNINTTIGKYQFILGFHKLINLEFSSAFVKIILGLTIMGLFFFYNLTVPFFFIESLFKIAIVLFLFPLFMVGAALDRKNFVKDGYKTFLSAILQIISLSIMCSVSSLLISYISNIDYSSLQDAIRNNDAQEIASQVYLMHSLNTNSLLQIVYTGILCWYLMGQALTIATKVQGYNATETLPNKFKDFSVSIIKKVTTVVRAGAGFKKETSGMADKLKSIMDKDINSKKGKGRNPGSGNGGNP